MAVTKAFILAINWYFRLLWWATHYSWQVFREGKKATPKRQDPSFKKNHYMLPWTMLRNRQTWSPNLITWLTTKCCHDKTGLKGMAKMTVYWGPLPISFLYDLCYVTHFWQSFENLLFRFVTIKINWYCTVAKPQAHSYLELSGLFHSIKKNWNIQNVYDSVFIKVVILSLKLKDWYSKSVSNLVELQFV